MTSTTMTVARSAFAIEDLDYYLVRASMIILFLFFGYAKWFKYDVQGLEPFITHGPLIFWLYPVLGAQRATWFLGLSEWTICSLLFLGFWDKRLGILGGAGATGTFIATVTVIPFFPNGWEQSAGGFPAMTFNTAFLMRDVVLLAVSFYLLKQDLVRTDFFRHR
jgi:uncharacterized membrane protein YkgB